MGTGEIDIKNLHPLEVKVIRGYNADAELYVEKIERELNFKSGNGNQALSWLAAKGVITENRRETEAYYEITGLGRDWHKNAPPEERIFNLVTAETGLGLPEIAEKLGLEQKDVGSAFGSLCKMGVLALDDAKKVAVRAPADEYFAVFRSLLEKGSNAQIREAELNEAEKKIMTAIAKKRGAADAAFKSGERETTIWTFNADIRDAIAAALVEAGISGEETGALTAEMLETGSWRGKPFRAYNVRVPPTRLIPGRTNAYAQFLENTKDKLVSLGFEEFDGPLVETEFWNCDALFMPQFHSARDIHDVYYLAEPKEAASIDEPWLSNVAAAHENGGKTGSRGWNYNFDHNMTRRLILRSQGTVMSAKTLPHAKIPGKYFGMLRCFRYDKVDATHLSDFYQTEGIVLGEDVNLRTLLGMLEMFAVEVAGAKEVKYVPGYFPFTEPSVEVHIKHPKLGWFELGGSGIFRPEVTESLGVHVPVAAWGIGIDRMALMALGLSDLRELFSYDIEAVRTRRGEV
ncbi:MAG: phenylalanine--tRNA ligase subunit alpha [Spirochaetaceae bacterium]|jgi:phenylalanyl-tRNA synthetase alpha chain|nr:phenylalanine--tRNA ligase subunit alpha [Spirochaetaceae bacterium]